MTSSFLLKQVGDIDSLPLLLLTGDLRGDPDSDLRGDPDSLSSESLLSPESVRLKRESTEVVRGGVFIVASIPLRDDDEEGNLKNLEGLEGFAVVVVVVEESSHSAGYFDFPNGLT